MHLALPGPVSLHPEVERAQSLPMINHRGPEFRELFERVTKKLMKVFGTDYFVATLTSSGTGAVEAMLANILEPKERMLVVQTGTFSDRMATIAKYLGIEVFMYEVKEGVGVTPEELDDVLRRVKPKVVGIVANETSTGVVHRNLKELAKVVHEREAIIAVDAVSFLGGHEFSMKETGVDIVASASQKALASPPGLGFVAYTKEMAEVIRKTEKRSLYWDLTTYEEFYFKKRETPATPAVSLIFALDKALDIIFEMGLDKWIERHAKFSSALNETIEKAGGRVYPKEGWRSNTIVVMYTPRGMTPSEVKRIAREKWGLDIGSGAWKLKDRTVRIGTMGWYDKDVIYRALKMVAELHGKGEVADEVFERYYK